MIADGYHTFVPYKKRYHKSVYGCNSPCCTFAISPSQARVCGNVEGSVKM